MKLKKISLFIISALLVSCNDSDLVDLNLKESLDFNQIYFVERVIDGDTIELKNGDIVRYLDIDTPETVHPSKPIECFGYQASEKNKTLVEGEQVVLQVHHTTPRDKYGRVLAYVYVYSSLGDSVLVNAELVQGGFARFNDYGNPGVLSGELEELEQKARIESVGLWGKCN